jgi:hypothetical protein
VSDPIELFNCVTCGKQNIVLPDDPPDVRCEFPDGKGNRHLLKIKEGDMVNRNTVNASTTATIQKPVIGKDAALPPVPPRPKEVNAAFRYYEEHRSEILADYGKLGLKAMLKRWNISQASWLAKTKSGRWYGLAVRWGIEESPVKPKRMGRPWPARGKPKSAAGGGVPGTPVKEMSKPEICRDCELAVQFRGYRQAVEDIFGKAVIKIGRVKDAA